jgi:tetratricopeptide (TPR) repeat protein
VVGALKPSSGALLARRLEEGTLISLEQMSPSVAKLPSAEDTALAFAEVGTMVAFLVARRGADAPRRLIAAIGTGATDREALESVWGGSFGSFDEAWREWASQLPLRRDAVHVIGLELAEQGKEEEDLGAIPDPQGRDFSRLGDLLRKRGRMVAAAVEYAKAYAEAPETPGVATRHARGLIFRGRYDEALEVADTALELYPDLAVLWYRKGEALLAQERYDEALGALHELLEINPFHLPARRGLLMAAQALEDEEEAGRQERALRLLEER